MRGLFERAEAKNIVEWLSRFFCDPGVPIRSCRDERRQEFRTIASHGSCDLKFMGTRHTRGLEPVGRAVDRSKAHQREEDTRTELTDVLVEGDPRIDNAFPYPFLS